MLGPTHRLTGALAGALLAAHNGLPLDLTVLTVLAATVTSNGPMSPDMDLTAAWQDGMSWMPRQLRKHRGVTHFWLLPVLTWLAVVPQLHEQAQWVAYAMLAGWLSHLAGDLLFGKLEVWPGGPDVGLGLKTGGWIEEGFGRSRSLSPARLLLGVALGLVLLGGVSGISHPVDAIASRF